MNDDEPSGVPLNTDLKLAIISAPTVDTAWLMQYIHPEKVPAIIVTSPSHDPQDDIPYGMESEPEPSLRFLGRTWVYCKPAFEGTGVMNASYMLVSTTMHSSLSSMPYFLIEYSCSTGQVDCV